ncbi:SDR family oxidoreductase [Salinimicrobium sp. CDJ15-91]|uniref:SDR family oxidoreductase n=2 Tax=Salinimicrobium oceani TaxID=2722702 RepID=A0ABX1D2G1_9FLAO|nr:SDR family oxidoreductase [Salinimicrobium oceani]
MVNFDFSGKTVMITGGSSGIGFATAQQFLKSGADVIVLSRNPERNFQKEEGLFTYAVDLNDSKAVNQTFQKIKEIHPYIDIAINAAAGETGLGKGIQEFSEEDFDTTINVNLKGLWLSMKYQIEKMLEHPERNCSIINISSVNGLGGVENGSLYAATKAAVLALTKSAALELASSNIAVNAVVPGAFDTELLKKAMLSQVNGEEGKLESVKEQYKKHIPKNRLGEPHEIASLILFLASGASDYFTGHSFVIDGGMSSRYR